jgi:alkaline phosphatase D
MPIHRACERIVLTLLVLVLGCSSKAKHERIPPRLTHGVASGEVTHDRAIVWARCNREGLLNVSIAGGPSVSTPVSKYRDFTGKALLERLTPDTTYTYRATCALDAESIATAAATANMAGRFRTAPAPDARMPVRFVWGGDLGGQNVCRDRERGYPIFNAIIDRTPDFFVALGDMIYGDSYCTNTGRYGNAQIPGPAQATSLQGYWAHWRYNRSDLSFLRMLAQTPYYAVLDDHEVRDDFGPNDHRTRAAPIVNRQPLLASGLAAFVDYAPMMAPRLTPTQLYRRLRWGGHVELFLLDTRLHRDRNDTEDSGAQPKTMLGSAQRSWLEAGLVDSTATWKVVVSSVPMAIPTGSYHRDGWADFEGTTGFERELTRILRTVQKSGTRNVIWITADVHFAAGYRYRPFTDAPGFTVHEFISGPLNAQPLSRHDLDDTLRPERLFFQGPPDGVVNSFDEALGWFNFGLVTIDADGELQIEIVDGLGDVRQQIALSPE